MNIDKKDVTGNAAPVGKAIASVFGPPSGSQSLLNKNFYNEYLYPVGYQACALLSAWGNKYEYRYSDVTRAIRVVTEAFASSVRPWGDNIRAIFTPVAESSLQHRAAGGTGPRVINERRMHACALSLDFCRDLLLYDLGFHDLLKNQLEACNWKDRPQGKLLAALSAQYLEYTALWLHGTASIEIFEDKSPYWKWANRDTRVIIVRHSARDVSATGWIDYPMHVAKFREELQDKIKLLAG